MYFSAAIYGQNTAIENLLGEIETKSKGRPDESRRKAILPLHTQYRRFGDKIEKKTPGKELFGLIIFAVTLH